MTVLVQEPGREAAAVGNSSKHKTSTLLLYWVQKYTGALLQQAHAAKTHTTFFHECMHPHVVICYAHADFINYFLRLMQQKLPTLTCLPGIKAITFTSKTAELFSSSPIRSGASECRAVGWALPRQMIPILECPTL